MSKRLKPAPDALTQLLDTSDRTEQAEKVAALMRALQQPPVTLVIHHDPRTGATTVLPVGLRVSFDAAHQVLIAAQEALRQQERQALTAKQELPPA